MKKGDTLRSLALQECEMQSIQTEDSIWGCKVQNPGEDPANEQEVINYEDSQVISQM